MQHIAPLLLSTLLVVLLTACSSDSTDDGKGKGRTVRNLSLMLYAGTYDDITPSASHRAQPFVSFDALSPRMSDAAASIHCFMTHATGVDFQGDFSYTGSSSWFSKIPLDDGTYQVYGFMPASELSKVTIDKQTKYETGAVITATGLPALTASDPCVIVGVGAGDGHTSLADMTSKLGSFSYNAGTEGDHLYVLLDHLYAALHLRLNIAEGYSELRTIKLTRLSLTAKSVKSVNVTATLTAGSANPLAVTTTSNTSGTGDEVVIYDGDEQQLSPSSALDFLACVAPGANQSFVLKTTYNVYDRNGNLIRKDRTTENTLTIPDDSKLTSGKKLIFRLTVNPTYIYVLSDPDLDDPKVTVVN